MNIFFSGSNLSFYDGDMKEDYVTAGTWPDDAVEMTDKERGAYWMQPAPEGKKLGSKKGRPAWVDVPPPPKEQLIAEAEAEKQRLIAEASQKTQLWQTQLMLDIITEEDKASLKEWMLYVQQVQAVDPSLGAAVVWPTPPASPAR
ncbi:tail fiber assembly protein [Morganella morganii]|uniref:tail fiber assembly protein n=1 Tax=Morganella morganii TaxID=582 RepID=UPI0032DAD263